MTEIRVNREFLNSTYAGFFERILRLYYKLDVHTVPESEYVSKLNEGIRITIEETTLNDIDWLMTQYVRLRGYIRRLRTSVWSKYKTYADRKLPYPEYITIKVNLNCLNGYFDKQIQITLCQDRDLHINRSPIMEGTELTVSDDITYGGGRHNTAWIRAIQRAQSSTYTSPLKRSQY